MEILALTFKVIVVLNGELEPLEAVVLQWYLSQSQRQSLEAFHP